MNYLIFGFGISGKSALELLYNKKDTFYLFDDDKKKRENLFSSYKTSPNIFVLKSINNTLLAEVDKIILSPALSPNDERIKKYKSKIFSELDIAQPFNKGKIIAITGTNGKTTTTSLISHILGVAHKKNFACGNIGMPLSAVAKKRGIKVCEESSFQIENSHIFSPDIFCLLNITPDHIDRHKTFSNYKKIKLSPLYNNQVKQVAVLNPHIKLSKNPICPIYTFGKSGQKGAYIKDENYVFFDGKREEIICHVSQSKLIGEHNSQNILCSIIVCKILGIKGKTIAKALSTFKPFPHRIELVYKTGNIKIYDDSKATNIDATLKCAKSFESEKNVVLILGGSLKGENFDNLFSNLPKNISHIYLIGQARFLLQKSIKKSPNKFAYSMCKNLKLATNLALSRLKRGVILLSPACASFDEFENYKDRGEKFLCYIKEFFDKKGG